MKNLIAHFYTVGLIPKFNLSMAIGISLGGSGGKSSSKSKSEVDQTKTSEQTTKNKSSTSGFERTKQDSEGKTTSESNKQSTGSETSVLSLLDEDTQNSIKNLMNDIALGDGGNQELLTLLESRALGADTAFDGLVDPQIAEARRLQENDLGSTVQALSRATGGGTASNSLVAGFNLEGSRAIDSSIASLAASLGIDARQGATDEITNAFTSGLQDEQSSSSAVAQLANVLKGATQTGTKQVQSSEQATSIQDVVQSLTSATSTSEIKSIIENLFSKENLVGTETTTGSGSTKEASAGFSLGI